MTAARDQSREAGAPAEAMGAYGDCADCGIRHALPQGQAKVHALGVMEEFRRLGRLDYCAPATAADPRLRFDALFARRGNMFGVLECVDADGKPVFLRAFSSLAEGIREIEGWVLPVLSAAVYREIILPAQAEIKRLTEVMQGPPAPSAAEQETLVAERRQVSQELWDRMCSLYHFRNFRGQERALREAVLPGARITGGMGECCAPKLLQHAALNGLRPRSIAEFYWGSSTEKKKPGEFYPSCEARCQPLLGFMLCGAEA